MGALFAFLLVARLGVPQTPPQAPTPQATFRASTHLIVQTVSVNDKRGNPVLGLTASDFIVTEDGVPQDVAFVSYEKLDTTPLAPVTSLTTGADPAAAGPPASTVAPVTRRTVSVPAPGDTKLSGRRLVILYIDLIGMSFFDKGRTFASANEFITRRMTAADMVAVMTFHGRGVDLRLDFTDDRRALGDAIEKLAIEASDEQLGFGTMDPGGAFGDDDGTFDLFTTDRQLSALQTAVTDLGPLPQQKTLIYFGGGLRVTGYENMAQLRATVNAAVRASVTLNPIDTRGLQAIPPMGDATRPSPGGLGMFSGTIAQSAVSRADRERDVLYAIAKDTGGRATFDTNDLAGGIADAASAVSGYYILGYYTKNIATDGKYRRVKITLANGLDAEVSYRAGYYGNKDFSKFNSVDKERQLLDALRLDDPVTEIPMAMEVNYFQISSVEYFVPISIRMPGSELTRPRPNGTSRALIDMIGEVKDEYNVTMRNSRDILEFNLDAANAGQVAKRPIQYETGFSLLPGTYTIKMLARDATTGRMGTYQRTFTIPNLEREAVRLPISTVVLTHQRVASTEALFTVKQKIPVSVANPLVHDGQKLVPGVTRTFSASRPLYVFLQAYERQPPPAATAGHGQPAAAMRPLAAFVTFYRDGVKVYETEATGLDSWDSKVKAVPIRLTVSLRTLEPGAYDCQVTVLDPSGDHAAFWRAPINVVR